MPKIEYVGTSHYREISKSDWKSVDIEHDAIKLARYDLRRSENLRGLPQSVEVSDNVLEFLNREEPGQFRVIQDRAASDDASDDEEAS
jgi:hypothetical protein